MNVLLGDGIACGQAEAAKRLELDPSLLLVTRDEAVRDGLARLRAADGIVRRLADSKESALRM